MEKRPSTGILIFKDTAGHGMADYVFTETPPLVNERGEVWPLDTRSYYVCKDMEGKAIFIPTDDCRPVLLI